MRILLLSLLILSISCGKKENQVEAVKASNELVQKSFATIYHEKGASIFRSKLLNAIVEESFPSATKAGAIEFHEELENSQLTDGEFSAYKEKESAMAKIIVSYPERTEIYFLSEGIDLEKIAARLDIRPEIRSKFKILKHSYTKTGRGQSFYLIDTSYEELMKNDQTYFEVQNDLKSQFSAKTIKYEANKKVEIFVEYAAYLQQTGVVTREGRSGRCTKDLVEAGGCGCTYKTYSPIDTYERYDGFSLSDLGLAMSLNGKMLSLSEMNNKKLRDNFFKITLDAESLAKNGEFQLVSVASRSIQKEGTIFAYEGYCLKGDKAPMTLASRVDFIVTVTISGRGELLRKISL